MHNEELFICYDIKLCINFRWHNHLDPAIKKDAWTEEEDSILFYHHQVYGNKWAEIARFLPGRYPLTPSFCMFEIMKGPLCDISKH